MREAHARECLNTELERINLVEAAKNEEAKQVRLEHQALLKNQMKDKAFQRAAAQYNKMQARVRKTNPSPSPNLNPNPYP